MGFYKKKSNFAKTTLDMMMRKPFLFLVSVFLMAQTSVVAQTTEKADPYPGDQTAWTAVKKTIVGWGTTDERYSRSQVPMVSRKPLALTAWRGERVSAQAVIAAAEAIGQVKVSVSDLKNGRNIIPSSHIRIYKVGYVIADNFQKNDSALVADRLVETAAFAVDAHQTRPVWFTVSIAQGAKAGRYSGTVTIDCDGQRHRLPLTVDVLDRILPQPHDWAFHLDLWQNPYAVARYYDVPLWSKQHFDLMRPIMQTLADAGQKVITCSIIQHPWNSQTLDPFESMIGKTKGVDGRWHYDYTVFDRWVEFMMSMGIDRQIDCYTLLPWHYRFDYYDQASNSVRYIHFEPGDKGYEDFLLPFLKDFAAHLKAKGWFQKTCIAIDERPTAQLKAAHAVMKKADAGWRMEGAYNYFPEFYSEVHDISVFYNNAIIEDHYIAERNQAGQPVTFYTCCGPDRPNTFTFSPPAEAAYMGWHAAAVGYDGYLRWAYNSWVADPCTDGRFRTWPSGDCFMVYPDGTSIRMERLMEGIQAFEKIRLLKAEFPDEIEEILTPFRATHMAADVDVETMVTTATKRLNDLCRTR